METVYDVDYFIEFYESKAENTWCCNMYSSGYGQYCAVGHFGVFDMKSFVKSSEANDLGFLFGGNGLEVPRVNDGYDPLYQQPTPKQRILASLYDIKANQMLEVAKEIISEHQKQKTELV